MMGVVNVITRNGSGINGTEFSSSYQTTEGMVQERLSMGKKLDNGIDALISFSGLQARGADRFFDFGSSGISGTANGLNGEDVKQGFARLSYKSLSFDFLYGNRHKEDPTSSLLSDPLTRTVLNNPHLQTQLQYNESFANNTLNVLARVFLGQYDFSQSFFLGGEKFRVTGPSSWHGAELRLLSTAITNHQLMMGVEYQNSTSIKQTFQNSATDENLIVTNSAVVRIGVYAQDGWRITDTLSATVGLRYDYNNWIGNRLSPRGALVWQATPKTTFKVLYGRAHRSPNSYERDFSSVAVTGAVNSGLNGETVDTTELVADYQPITNMIVRASAYYWNMHGIITEQFDLATNNFVYQPTPHRIIAKGTELSVDKTWDWGARTRASFGIQDADQHHSHLPNSPYHLGKLNLSVPIPLMKNLRAGYELQYYGKRKTVDGPNTDSYFLSNLNLVTDVRWVKGLEASLSIYNLFDENYQHPTTASNWQNIFLQPDGTLRFRMDYRF
ncbi:TonB-dependent receptor [Nitrosomonas sp.]|uniref:TonB-dependent receptor plug domain-containing protein n=1 Tax=Nitrosomonas sp. TaxID=42353 RepID=UPI002622D1D2|nr:TonB-dependent receptor [Nitrosomonas sp.]